MTERDTMVETASAIRPFRVDVLEADLDDLRRRIAATRWPDRETVPDRSQGAKLAELQGQCDHGTRAAAVARRTRFSARRDIVRKETPCPRH